MVSKKSLLSKNTFWEWSSKLYFQNMFLAKSKVEKWVPKLTLSLPKIWRRRKKKMYICIWKFGLKIYICPSKLNTSHFKLKINLKNLKKIENGHLTHMCLVLKFVCLSVLYFYFFTFLCLHFFFLPSNTNGISIIWLLTFMFYAISFLNGILLLTFQFLSQLRHDHYQSWIFFRTTFHYRIKDDFFCTLTKKKKNYDIWYKINYKWFSQFKTTSSSILIDHKKLSNKIHKKIRKNHFI